LVIGIISEYNPFHKGHKYQIDKIKEKYPESTVVALMSGNVTQRGEYALFEKYERAKSAIICGVDCVFEIPYPFCASNAEVFARAGVHIATSIGVTHLCFGTESGSVDYISSIAGIIDSLEFEEKIKSFLKDKKLSYSSARERALLEFGIKPPKKSNDILGVEYIRAINKYSYPIQPITVKREGADYNDLSQTDVMSASAIREYFVNNNTIISVPDALHKQYADLVENGEYVNQKDADEYLFKNIVSMSADEISRCYDIPVGAEFFIYDTAMSSRSSAEFFANLATKTYTHSRLKRIVMYAAHGTNAVDEFPLYTVLLGANHKGRDFMKQQRKNSSISVLTKLADYKNYGDETEKQFEASSKVDKIYMTFLRGESPSSFIKKSPYIEL